MSNSLKKNILRSLLILVLIVICILTVFSLSVTSSSIFSVDHDGTNSGITYKDRYYNTTSQSGPDFNFYITYDGTFIFERFNCNPGDDFTFLMTEGDFATLNSNNDDIIAYINQITTNEQGYGRIQFRLNSRFSFKENMYIGSNTTSGNELIKISDIKLGDLYMSSGDTNNILKIGYDLYHLESDEINKPDTVLDSIRTGGNTLYYNLNGIWYDLMDDKATSNDFLVKANALDREISDNWSIRYYYIPKSIADALNNSNPIITINRNYP